MTACSREPEIRSLLDRGHWPAAASPELTAHAAACTRCSQLLLLTQAFRADRTRAAASVRLEAPGVLWWRAQLRRRNADLQRLQRPLLGAQIFSVLLSLVAAAIFLASQSKATLAWIAAVPHVLHFESLLPEPLQSPLGLAALIAGILALIAAVAKALAYATSETRD
ncbi:hypothetical protein DYQ86_23155 [Acidobacteria bacterium AB60]|nr:hypothetical protein DYQ86_23155 [Acidobacteria bacterium AB60]